MEFEVETAGDGRTKAVNVTGPAGATPQVRNAPARAVCGRLAAGDPGRQSESARPRRRPTIRPRRPQGAQAEPQRAPPRPTPAPSRRVLPGAPLSEEGQRRHQACVAAAAAGGGAPACTTQGWPTQPTQQKQRTTGAPIQHTATTRRRRGVYRRRGEGASSQAAGAACSCKACRAARPGSPAACRCARQPSSPRPSRRPCRAGRWRPRGRTIPRLAGGCISALAWPAAQGRGAPAQAQAAHVLRAHARHAADWPAQHSRAGGARCHARRQRGMGWRPRPCHISQQLAAPAPRSLSPARLRSSSAAPRTRAPGVLQAAVRAAYAAPCPTCSTRCIWRRSPPHRVSVGGPAPSRAGTAQRTATGPQAQGAAQPPHLCTPLPPPRRRWWCIICHSPPRGSSSRTGLKTGTRSEQM